MFLEKNICDRISSCDFSILYFLSYKISCNALIFCVFYHLLMQKNNLLTLNKKHTLTIHTTYNK